MWNVDSWRRTAIIIFKIVECDQRAAAELRRLRDVGAAALGGAVRQPDQAAAVQLPALHAHRQRGALLVRAQALPLAA